ncbi:MAG: hypothetical protein JWR16_1761 [Nevskia sp.]|nr:hypothetical protein [Nevskia sp.]
MGLLGTISLAIGGFFALEGFWPILPFAGLELAAVGLALAHSLRRNAYREVVSFEAATIAIAFGMAGRGAAAKLTLSRVGTRVVVEAGPYRNSPTRLCLSCGGQSVELGHCLTDAERERIAVRMRELIHPGWRAPVRQAAPVESWLQN